MGFVETERGFLSCRMQKIVVSCLGEKVSFRWKSRGEIYIY